MSLSPLFAPNVLGLTCTLIRDRKAPYENCSGQLGHANSPLALTGWLWPPCVSHAILFNPIQPIASIGGKAPKAAAH